MKKLLSKLILYLLVFMASSAMAQHKGSFEGNKADQDSLKKTSIAIRAAFFKADVDGILLYHHPEVTKALDYQTYQQGLTALRPGLQGTMAAFHLDFVENNTESLYINGDTAVEQTLFTIKGTPTGDGKPFVFKGRSMIVYVRCKDSPTGWATIREMIQPATSQ